MCYTNVTDTAQLDHVRGTQTINYKTSQYKGQTHKAPPVSCLVVIIWWLEAISDSLQNQPVCEGESVFYCNFFSSFSWENSPLSTQTFPSKGHVKRNYSEDLMTGCLIELKNSLIFWRKCLTQTSIQTHVVKEQFNILGNTLNFLSESEMKRWTSVSCLCVKYAAGDRTWLA